MTGLSRTAGEMYRGAAIAGRNSEIRGAGVYYFSGTQRIEPQHQLRAQIFSATRTAIQHRFSEEERLVESLWRDTQSTPGHQDTVSVLTKNNASEFLRSLPLDVNAKPDIDVMPNGQISLDWASKRNGDITVIVKNGEIQFGQRLPSGNLYSALFKWLGTPPKDLVERIRQVIS